MQYNLITRQSLSQLTQWMSWANRANGVLMVLTGLFAFLGAFSCGVGCELYKYFMSKFIEEAELADYKENEEDRTGDIALRL